VIDSFLEPGQEQLPRHEHRRDHGDREQAGVADEDPRTQAEAEPPQPRRHRPA
jgi:hypothetical protein